MNNNNQVHCWCDSTITLDWIHAEPSRFKPYVANRISVIQTNIDKTHWHKVYTKENPADIASRGVMPNQLATETLWFKGPAWLEEEFELTPYRPDQAPQVWPAEIQSELKRTEVTLHFKIEPTFIEKFSDYHHLIKSVACILRWKLNFQLRKDGHPPIQGIFSVQERNKAFDAICAYIQQQHFPAEYKILSA